MPPQHKDVKELSERLSAATKTRDMEREQHCRERENLQRSEQKAKAKAERLPSLMEQLTFLQRELENTRSEKEVLEDQNSVYKKQTQEASVLLFSYFSSLSSRMLCLRLCPQMSMLSLLCTAAMTLLRFCWKGKKMACFLHIS